MSKYTLPLYYTVHSRSHGLHFISYVLMVFLPPLLQLFFLKPDFSLWQGLIYVLAFLGMISTYECGYLVNDVICIKNDPQPTNRIPKEEQLRIERKLSYIILSKILVCICIIFFLASFDSSNILFYCLCNFFIFVIYIIHNNFRNWVPFITVFFLTTLNYFTPLAFFINLDNCRSYLFFIILCFSIPKTFFYIIRKTTKQVVKNENLKFCFYYLGVSCITTILSLMNLTNLALVIIPSYLSLYRFAIFIVNKLK